MPKYSSKLFEGVSKKNVKKSFQDLSHEWNHDFNPGYLIPFLMIPTLPGDEFEIECEFFFKFSPLYFPILHRLKLEADLYFVPNRIMWPEVVGDPDTGWTNWIMLRNEVLHPTIDCDMGDASAASNNSVMGYFGIPYLVLGAGRTVEIDGLNAFPAMAYLMIWDQYYRNPQLEDPRAFPLVAGDNTTAMRAAYGYTTPTAARLNVLPAKWPMDYFTAAIPTPQLGDAINIPMLTDEAPPYTNQVVRDRVTGLPVATGDLSAGPSGEIEHGIGNVDVIIDQTPTAPSIRQLRLAEVLQQFRERLLKIGQRYRDYVIGLFDEDPTPMDISVPVLFGSYRGTVQVSEVLAQANVVGSEIDIDSGQYSGNMALYEQPNNVHRFRPHEHGLIIGILSIVPTTRYGQGLNRYWRYSTPYDYPMDIFCSVGDQEIRKEELFFQNLIAEQENNSTTFGYIPKYSEARTIVNSYGSNLGLKNGLGLSTHLGRWFDPETTIGAVYDELVELDNFFVSAHPGQSTGIRTSDVWRVLTFPTGSTSENVIIGYVYNSVKALRPLPMFSTPGDKV